MFYEYGQSKKASVASVQCNWINLKWINYLFIQLYNILIKIKCRYR